MIGVRKLAVVGFATLGALSGGLLASGVSALAAEEVVFQKSFGTAGSGEGQLSSPTGVAVSQSSGEVYVVDTGNNRVERFSAAGSYVGQFDGSEAPTGAFSGPNAIAVDSSTSGSDPSAGDVYVSDAGHDVVDKFTAAGVYLGQLTGTASGPFLEVLGGVAVDPQGHLWVYEGEGPLDEFDNAVSNAFLGQSAPGFGVTPGIAVDSKDDVYGVFGFYHSIFKVLPSEGGLEFIAGQQGCECVTGVAVGPSTDDVYADHGTSVVEYGPFGEPHEQAVAQFGAGRLIGGGGIAIDSAGRLAVYVVDTAGNTVDRFLSLPVPQVAVPSGVQGTSTGVSAVLRGAVTPGGATVIGCRFEYGTVAGGAFAQSVPCAQVPPLSGGGAISVSADVSVAPDTAYHYRLAVVYAEDEGEPVASAGAETLITPPIVEGSALASNITSFAATLTGVIGSGELTPTYHFAYGPTSAYGSSFPQPDANAAAGGLQTVSQTLTGLQPGTTYHYALVTTNFGGTVSTGPDATFTTRPLVPPAVSTGGPLEVGQGTATLTGAVNAEGLPTTYRFEYGTTTGYGSSWPGIEVFAGSASASQSVAVAVPSLQPGATYHYRLAATNEDGTTYGTDQTLTTQGYPTSTVQPTPVLTTKLGFVDPEASHSRHKHKSKGKRRARRRNKHGGGAKSRHKRGRKG